MAEVKISVELPSNILPKNKSYSDVINCEKCWNYETHVKEALEELISLRAANELLQKSCFYARPERPRGKLTKALLVLIVMWMLMVPNNP